MKIRSKVIFGAILIASLFLTSCAERQKKAVAKIEALLTPQADTPDGNKTVACAIVSIPSKLEMQREYEKQRGPKPLLSNYNNLYTPADGRERDAVDKKYKYGVENLEEQYSKLTEAERNEKRKEDYNHDLNKWEKGPSEKTSSLFKSIENKTVALSNTKGIRLVDRSKMEEILKEHSFQNSSQWASEKNIAEVGKALNVQYLVYVKPVIGTGSTSDINFEFVNVSTFQKLILKCGMGFDKAEVRNLINAAYIDSSESSPANTIDGTWFCKGIMTNGVNYTETTEQFLSPFSSGYPLEEPKKIPKTISSQLKGSKIYINSNYATITKNGETIECEFSYNPDYSHIFGGKREWKDKGDEYYTIVAFSHWWEGDVSPKHPLTNCYVGTLTIFSEDGELSISDKVYEKDDTLAIHLGSAGKRKKQHYYLVFSKLKG